MTAPIYGVLLRQQFGGMNAEDILLADMIASHGSTIFTAASGNFHFRYVIQWLPI